MPAKDIYHDCVIRALEKDGWKITANPLKLKLGMKKLYVDLGAEKLLIAEKGARKIAVEIKSFIGKSIIADSEVAVGQYVFYDKLLAESEPDRELFLAVESEVFAELMSDELGTFLTEKIGLKMLVFDKVTEEIVEWKT